MKECYRIAAIHACALLGAVSVPGSTVVAQLRIVSYNTATADPEGGFTTARTGSDTVLAAIGAESVGGIAKPIDVLLLQEQYTMATAAQSFVDLLNDLYDPIARTMYARSTIDGDTSDFLARGGRPGLVYNTQAVSLIDEIAFGTANGSNQARQALRYQLRPVGYDSSADFYAYNDHYKAGSTSTDQARRLIEAQAVRSNADALGQDQHIIYAGDYNIRSSSESMYSELLLAGDGEAFDPINTAGTWHNSSSLRITHTQSPVTSSQFPGQATGGVDDRFDFQLVSDELQDGEGLSYLSGSYHAFGNNATHSCCNSPITTGTGAAPNVLTALTTASDHLPVVADYQLPAILDVQLAALPPTIPLGSSVHVDVFVENIANVISSLGADELDYTLSVSGDLFGSANGTDFALGGSNAHPITLDTSVAGLRSGTVTVSSSSQSAANALVNIPVNFIVGGGGPFFGVIAKDDFDSLLNRVSFVQTPAPGAFSSPADGFEQYQVGVNATISFSLLDDSVVEFPADTQGIVDRETKTDAWFGVADILNTQNPGGTGSATWEFDISGATDLQVSIDMGAMGDFESIDLFDWTYEIDGGGALPLFTSSVDEAASATYTLASGTVVNRDDPLSMTGTSGPTVELSNLFQTMTSLLVGSGSTLTIELQAATDDDNFIEGYAFDNIFIEGLTGGTFLAADFNQDGNVDALDLAQWEGDFGINDESDADGDGDSDGADLLVWQQQLGTSPPLFASSQAVPEPATAALLGLSALVSIGRFERRHRNLSGNGCCGVRPRG